MLLYNNKLNLSCTKQKGNLVSDFLSITEPRPEPCSQLPDGSTEILLDHLKPGMTPKDLTQQVNITYNVLLNINLTAYQIRNNLQKGWTRALCNKTKATNFFLSFCIA